ncbi:hypothetical protein, partial [Alistipes ihumii]|uniref:hypothetical protein n=1 Tax=Alistipes ihumii TaxID=1470347 RepID=UPI003A8A8A1A
MNIHLLRMQISEQLFGIATGFFRFLSTDYSYAGGLPDLFVSRRLYVFSSSYWGHYARRSAASGRVEDSAAGFTIARRECGHWL